MASFIVVNDTVDIWHYFHEYVAVT